MNGELDRLRKLYGELGDEHLQDLSTDMGDLTDDAQLALLEELRRRGLAVPAPPQAERVDTPAVRAESRGVEHAYGFGVGIPGVVPGGEPAMEHALEPGGQTRMGMTALTAFFDGLELSRACEVLEEANIEPAIEEISGDETTGTAPRFEVWVSSADLERSRSVLRTRMGLFPVAENDDGPEDELEMSGGDGVVGQFESRAEADEVRAVLEQSGVAATVEEVEDGWLVKTAQADQERALGLVAARLGVN